MENRNHPNTTKIVTFSAIDGITRVYEAATSASVASLEYVKTFVENGGYDKLEKPVGSDDVWNEAVEIYENLGCSIKYQIARECCHDDTLAKTVLAEASAQAKQKGELAAKSLIKRKATITRMKNGNRHSMAIAHEYECILSEYGTYTLLGFDYHEPVCACCGRKFPREYMLEAGHTAVCMMCATEIDIETTTRIPTAVAEQIVKELHKSPYSFGKTTEEEISAYNSFAVASQRDFLSFASEMADYMVAHSETDTSRAFNHVWVTRSTRKFKENIERVSAVEKELQSNSQKLTSNDLVNLLLVPRYDLGELELLVQQLLAEREEN